MIKKVLTCVAAGLTAVILLLVGILLHVILATRSQAFTRVQDAPEKRVAIVFGARVSGRVPSPILRDRVDAAVRLYQAGKVKKILMSGDNSFEDYNEVQVMLDYAVGEGVPKEDIVLDHAGRSTYDTCYRAHAIFGLDEAILVTQRYHMFRALYICNRVGVASTGYALEDFSLYPNLRNSYTLREGLAIIKAWFDVHIGKPEAEIMGAKEPAI
jgi:vancomycin permeability regulator SanA